MLKASLTRTVQWLKDFRADEDGAVTTDFVVLTASVMMMGAAHVNDIATQSVGIADKVEDCLADDIGDLLVGGDPETYLANLQSAAAACSSR
ncbi:hypothetical protein [Pseudooctadecabacter sp.]|uniref:hypothetical protein n=1 Tax=Pseudooctadecabacter sp. TaxID=1966338 RepID=UPI0025EDBAAB|nr:hypothetical protein [Pseudooctadecabacter sp.]